MRKLVAAGILVLALAGCAAGHKANGSGTTIKPVTSLNTYRTVGGNCYDNGQLAFYGACYSGPGAP